MINNDPISIGLMMRSSLKLAQQDAHTCPERAIQWLNDFFDRYAALYGEPIPANIQDNLIQVLIPHL